MKILILPVAIIAIACSTHAQPCQDPTDPACVSTNNPGTNTWTSPPVTNAIGYPVVRLSAIRASHTNILGTGFTVATNYGFEVVNTNYLTSRYETLTNFNGAKYFHFYVAVTNTDPARRYTLLNAADSINGAYYPLDLGWNGLGTNGEYQLNGFVTLANPFDGRFFKVKDIGEAE